VKPSKSPRVVSRENAVMPNIMSSARSAAAALVILSLASTGLLVVGLLNYFNYSNPYTYVPTGPITLIDADISPKANHTLIIVLDGVRADVFYAIDKPSLDYFGSWANLTDIQCSTLISVSRAGYGVIPSGVNTSESQVIANEHTGPFTADSLWRSTLRHDGTTAFVGSETWHELFGEWMNYSITFSESVPGEETLVVNTTSGYAPIEQELPAYSDGLISAYAVELVTTHLPTFTVVHFCETDEIGHENGSLSDSYRAAIERQDAYIGEILSAYDALGILNSTLVMVTSDHGQTDFPGKGGEHGGIEPEVLHTPLLMRGPRVVPGIYSDSHHQNSIAPTAAVVMGWEIPYDASGSVLFDSLNLSLREESIYRINQASLRLEQGKARAQVMGHAEMLASDIDAAGSLLSQAESNFSAGLYEQAIDAAMAAEESSIMILQFSLYSKISEETAIRLAVLLLSGCMIGGVIIVSRRARRVLVEAVPVRQRAVMIALPMSVYLIILPITTVLSGWQFSASYLAAYFDELFLRLFAIVLVPFVTAVAVLLLIQRYVAKKQDQSEVMTSAKGFIASTAILYLLSVSLIIVFNGNGLPWHAQDVTVPLMYFFILLSAIAFAVYSAVTLGIGHIYAFRKRK